jgi:glycosyltransferase 2 family protein
LHIPLSRYRKEHGFLIQPREARRLRIFLTTVVKLCLTFGFFYWIWKSLPDGANWQGVTLLHPTLLLACIPAVMVQMALLAWRWMILTCGLAADLPNRQNLKFWRFFKLTWLSLSISQVLPAVIGGDGFRVASLRYDGIPLGLSAKSVVLDRMFGLAGLTMLVIPGLMASDLVGNGRLWFVVAVAILAMSAAVGLAWRRFPALRLFPLGSVLARGRGVEYLILAILGHSLSVCVFQFLSEAYGIAIPLSVTLTVFPTALLMSMLPISFGGWGVREASVVYGLSLYGISEHDALLASIIFGTFQLCTALPSVAVFLSWARQNQR